MNFMLPKTGTMDTLNYIDFTGPTFLMEPSHTDIELQCKRMEFMLWESEECDSKTIVYQMEVKLYGKYDNIAADSIVKETLEWIFNTAIYNFEIQHIHQGSLIIGVKAPEKELKVLKSVLLHKNHDLKPQSLKDVLAFLQKESDDRRKLSEHIGSAKKRTIWKQLAELKENWDKVEVYMKNYIQNDKLVEEIEACSLFLLPDDDQKKSYEGFGKPCLAAIEKLDSQSKEINELETGIKEKIKKGNAEFTKVSDSIDLYVLVKDKIKAYEDHTNSLLKRKSVSNLNKVKQNLDDEIKKIEENWQTLCKYIKNLKVVKNEEEWNEFAKLCFDPYGKIENSNPSPPFDATHMLSIFKREGRNPKDTIKGYNPSPFKFQNYIVAVNEKCYEYVENFLNLERDDKLKNIQKNKDVKQKIEKRKVDLYHQIEKPTNGFKAKLEEYKKDLEMFQMRRDRQELPGITYTEVSMPAQQVCGLAGNLYNGGSKGDLDCRKKCENNDRCKFYTIWLSNNWCRLNPVCDEPFQLQAQQEAHTLKTYTKIGLIQRLDSDSD